ncbi:MAG TPA: substrate-binding domain-containing protein [Candidatus Limnocylindrales bacterium]
MNTKKFALAIVAIAAVVGACSGSTASASSSGGVALLLPENHTARYEAADKPMFTTKFNAVCGGVSLNYQNAADNEATQLTQAEAAINAGAKVLVLDPVNGATATAIMKAATDKGVKVISYDRLITAPSTTPDWYISFDNQKVGALQGAALLAKLNSMSLGHTPNVLWINGSPKDNNATLFKAGAHSVLDGKVTIVKEDAMANWQQSEAQALMDGWITSVTATGYDGVYVANDGGAAGVYASETSKGVDPKTKPSTGQDAALDAIQRIVLGTQYMTVYKKVQTEAEAAAVLACSLAKGETTVPSDLQSSVSADGVDNGTAKIKSILLTPIAVTVDGSNGTSKVSDTIVADKFYGDTTVTQICDTKADPGLPAACTAAGVK